MSHFTVLVIAEDTAAALAPFQENNMGDCPREYMEFNDVEDEYREKYDSDTAKRVVMPDGSLKTPWDEEFRVRGFGIGSDTHKVPEHLEQREVPFKELYASLGSFIEDYAGYKRDPEMGRYGYWENPNRKWDWWQVGGRWSNKLLMKSGARGNEGFAGEIDWEGMLAEERAKAAELYDRVTAVIAGREVQSWAQVLKRRDAGEFDIDGARNFYHEQQVVKDLIATKAIDRWDGAEDLSGVLAAKDRDSYIDRSAKAASTTWALLHNGYWTERGRMGWFAMSDATEGSTLDYAENYWLTIRSLPANARVAVVDCHI